MTHLALILVFCLSASASERCWPASSLLVKIQDAPQEARTTPQRTKAWVAYATATLEAGEHYNEAAFWQTEALKTHKHAYTLKAERAYQRYAESMAKSYRWHERYEQLCRRMP